MAQKPVLRTEEYAHAMRASQNRKKAETYPCCVSYIENKWSPNMERIMKAQVLLDDSYFKKHKKY